LDLRRQNFDCGHAQATALLLTAIVRELPFAIQSGSLTSLQQRPSKTGGRLIRHSRYFILRLAESQLTQRLFAQMIRRIERLAWHPT